MEELSVGCVAEQGRLVAPVALYRPAPVPCCAARVLRPIDPQHGRPHTSCG